MRDGLYCTGLYCHAEIGSCHKCVRVSCDIDFKKELVDLHGSILVTTQCVELRHRSQKDEINIISRQKYPQTPKKGRDLPPATLAPPGCKLDSFLSIRCDH
jgi:hypothetical protein